jgi:CDP-glucose 4,6-dehydratase
MFNNAYKNKRVLVTGHTGFKGSWLLIWLKELGADVIGYSLEPPTQLNNFEACQLEKKITHIHGDVRHMDHLFEVFKKYEPEFVFHLAAQSLVHLSYEEPKLTIDTNVGGTVNLLEAVRLIPSVKVLVNVTSDKCYENREWVWGYRESDPMGGHDPYSASKGCAELVFNAYLKSFFNKEYSEDRSIGAASVRAGNVIGGGDWGKDRIIPDCVRALSADKPIGIRSPEAIRPWQHVLEPLSGYLWLGALLWEYPNNYSGAWNFGPRSANDLKVKDIVQKFINLWGSGNYVDLSTPKSSNLMALHPFPREAVTLRLCCDKAISYLKWYGALLIDECLFLTADWYKHYYENRYEDKMYQVCSDQIREYTQKARDRGLLWATDQGSLPYKISHALLDKD